MKKKSDVVEVFGSASWTDTYMQGSAVVFATLKEQLVKYETLNYDYSQTTQQWAERKTKPWIFVPPTSVHTSDVRGQKCVFSLKLDSPSWNSSRTYAGDIFPPIDALKYTGIESSDWTAPLLEAQNDLKGMKVNLGEAFLEAGQTANMICDSLFRLATMARDLRRGRFHNPFRPGSQIARDFAQLWLEYKYGWLPLLHDVYGAYEILRDRDKVRPYQIMGKGKSKNERVKRAEVLSLYDYTGAHATLFWKGTAKVRSKTKLYFKVDWDATTWQRETAIDNPALVAWESVPYSFVAEWFLPISDYLNAMGYADGLIYNGGFTSVVSEVEVLYETDGKDSSRSKSKHSTKQNFTVVRSKFHKRVAHATVPPVPFPSLDPKGLFHGTRIVSAVALLLGLLNGRHSSEVPLIRY